MWLLFEAFKNGYIFKIKRPHMQTGKALLHDWGNKINQYHSKVYKNNLHGLIKHGWQMKFQKDVSVNEL